MGVQIEIAAPGQAELDALGLPLAQPLDDGKLGGRLKELAASGEFRGERAEALVLHSAGDLEAPRVVLAGLGARGDVDLDALRTAAAVTVQTLARVGGTLGWQLDDSLPLSLADQAAALVEGTIIGGYAPGRWKTQDAGKQPRPIERIVIAHAETPELRAAAERAALLAERTNRARDLANMPPNELNPHTLAEQAQALAGELDHLKAEILGPRELDKLGMGALSAVGRGSRNEPRLIVLRYDPPSATHEDVLFGVVGKAFSFDAGGI